MVQLLYGNTTQLGDIVILIGCNMYYWKSLMNAVLGCRFQKLLFTVVHSLFLFGMGAGHSQLNSNKKNPREVRLQRLLQDPSFHLIKIVRTGKNIESLTVVTPALDRSIAQDVEKIGFHCVSHLWGADSDWVDWDGPDVVSADTGEVLTAKVLPNKSSQIIDLFETWSAYTWIDVFCARSSTPLVIMGDVYNLCTRCFAFIDTSFHNAETEFQRLHMHAKQNMEPNMDQCAQEYVDALVSNSTDAIRSLHERMENETDHQKKEIFDHYIVSSGEELNAAVRGCDLDSPEYNVIKDIMHARKRERWEALGLHRYADLISAVLDSHWMSRVWMIQESALPFIVSLKSLGGGKGGPQYDTFASFYYLQKGLQICLQTTAKAYQIRRKAVTKLTSQWSQEQTPTSPRQLLKFYHEVDPPLARIYADYRKLLEMVLVMGPCQEYSAEIDMVDIQLLYLNTFATSERNASCSMDYVYGVLGIIDIDVPSSKDAQMVWRIYSEKLREKFPSVEVPYEMDLMNATIMEDVYGSFGFINDDFMLASDKIVDFIGERQMSDLLHRFD